MKIEDRDYNSNGTVSKITDGNGTITTFGYDTKGNLTSVNNPAPLGDITLTPDALSRLRTQVDGKGQTTTYTYDPIDRPDVTSFAGGLTVDRDYDPNGNLVRLADPTGITTFAYDKRNRQTRKTLPNNQQLRYGYDHNGNLTTYSDAGGDVIYTYDQANLLRTLREPGAPSPVRFDYDNNNRRTKTTYPTSPATVMEIGYDGSGRQTSIKATGGTTTLASFTYSYTKSGADTALRQSVTEPAGTTSYSYDGLNRLTGATGPGLTRSYAYNIDFNRTSKTENGATTYYGYNAANQMCWSGPASGTATSCTVPSGNTSYNYDGNGNLTGSTSGWSLAYNPANQTTSISRPGGTALSPLAYAGPDQTERRQAGAIVYATSALGLAYATDPTVTLTSDTTTLVDADEGKPPKGQTHYYTRDSDGNPVSLRTDTGRYYYLFDGLGSIVGLVDATATKVNNYRYDPYGTQLAASQTVPNPLRYTGGHHDGQTGLTKLGTRYYNPTDGRFTQLDPSGQDLPYAYAGCDPVNHTDPTGTQSCALFIGSVVIVGVGLISGGIAYAAATAAVGGLTALGFGIAITDLALAVGGAVIAGFARPEGC